MNVNRVVEVSSGDAVAALQDFLAAWWACASPDALLAPVEGAAGSEVLPQVIQAPDELRGVNPFAPVMFCNAASLAHQFIRAHPAERLAVMLRPCELRAFVEIQKRQPALPGSLAALIIGVDCLGTFPRAEYQRSLKDQGAVMEGAAGSARRARELALEVLRNAADGGLRPQGFRTACQVCDWPAPRGADLVIGTGGVDTSEYLLIIASDPDLDARLCLGKVTNGQASEYQVSRREMLVGAIADARAGVRRKMLESLQSDCRFNDLGCLLALFANCSLCGECLKACPLGSREFDGLLNERRAFQGGRAPLAELVALSHWLASCSGCGMCEQQCSWNVPLTLLISALSHSIRDELRYISGDPQQQLPWVKV
jgi:formate dehydrogenase subunit beta